MSITNKAVRYSGRILALLGSTNTGKTHYAMERMLAHGSGMIGFPLRLLARENYDRAVVAKGRHNVALVTGEEKIIPPHARYYLCTTEAMPVDQDFDFVGIDEVQLAGDPERGHIFTDRILRARGKQETMFMGAETMRHLLAALVPGVEFETRPRLSALSYTGYKNLTRLPKRSAIVAFGVDDVYAIAESVRRQRGGTAVVLGALSPRTRNAQVDMYQAGEVDFMVATDAIGMGLNMDIHHVALASTRKFDGQRPRSLTNAEIAQIAGRAGRYMRDGTFGVTGRVKELDAEIVEAIENHNFQNLQDIYWRNADLDFSNPRALLRSLDLHSGSAILVKGRPSDDYLTLHALCRREDILALAGNKSGVGLLWAVCQIPDFRQTLSDAHQELMAELFRRLSIGMLPEDWVAAQVERLDNTQGDVDTLTARIAHVRTWTYISFQSEWLQRPEYWQEKTRALEDRLSDALHDALINRFVDRRSTVLMRSSEEGQALMAGVRGNGEVVVEGHLIGQLQGFRFIPDETAQGEDYKAVMTAARGALKSEISNRLNKMLNATDKQVKLQDDGRIFYQPDASNPLPGDPVAKIKKGRDALTPEVEVLSSELLAATDQGAAKEFLSGWLKRHIAVVLEPLMRLQETDALAGPVRGICFQVLEAMGIVPREQLEDLIKDLDADMRQALRNKKVRLGPILVFLPELNKPAAVRLRGLLWALNNEKPLPAGVPNDGIVSIKIDPKTIDRGFYQSIGYPVYGSRAIRIDMLDRVINAIYENAKEGKFQAQHAMAEWLGCPIDDLYEILTAMGHRRIVESNPQPEEVKSEAAAEVKAEEPAEKTEAAVPVPTNVKPQLSFFRLKKGKAFEKPPERVPFKKKPHAEGQQERKPNKFKGKKDKGRDKEVREPRVLTAGPKPKAEDSPFAILEQLKNRKDAS